MQQGIICLHLVLGVATSNLTNMVQFLRQNLKLNIVLFICWGWKLRDSFLLAMKNEVDNYEAYEKTQFQPAQSYGILSM